MKLAEVLAKIPDSVTKFTDSYGNTRSRDEVVSHDTLLNSDLNEGFELLKNGDRYSIICFDRMLDEFRSIYTSITEKDGVDRKDLINTLTDARLRADYNLSCYSTNWLATNPKKGFEQPFEEWKQKLNTIDRLLKMYSPI